MIVAFLMLHFEALLPAGSEDFAYKLIYLTLKEWLQDRREGLERWSMKMQYSLSKAKERTRRKKKNEIA